MDDQTDLHRLADALNASAGDLEAELEWLARVLERRLAAYFAEPSTSPELPDEGLPAPPLDAGTSPFAAFVRGHGLAAAERLLLALALAPHLRPQLLDVLWTRNETTGRGFTEFGGMPTSGSGGFLPSGQTAAFLLAGDRLAGRLATAQMLEAGQRLDRLDVLHLGPVTAGEAALAGPLLVSPRALGLLMHGDAGGENFDPQFPARRANTQLDWVDLVLPATTLAQLEEIRSWLTHGPTLLHDWGMKRRLRPGYTALFHGAAGTGKTLAACLLGSLCARPVYRIDLSLVVSKYIGETEKNLARVFDEAEQRGWMLFFDEADALFGKRTRVEDSHDRYANQEVSFLLQRIEDFDGVVILASNLRANIDDAFLRRFQSVVHFPMPRPAERLRLWREAFPARAELDAALDLARLSERHELSGGTIINVVRFVCLRALERGERRIFADDVEEGIRREMLKEGRAF